MTRHVKARQCRALLAGLALLRASASGAADLADVLRDVRWGEPASTLSAALGERAMRRLQPIDFGDSYAEIVRRDVGLTGQLLVRISPPEADGAGCPAPPLPR